MGYLCTGGGLSIDTAFERAETLRQALSSLQPAYIYEVDISEVKAGQRFRQENNTREYILCDTVGCIEGNVQMSQSPKKDKVIAFSLEENHLCQWSTKGIPSPVLVAEKPTPVINWLTQEYIQGEAKKGNLPALMCSIEHWEQMLKAGPKRLREAKMANRVSEQGNYCALCIKAKGTDNPGTCEKCIMKKDGESCVIEWHNASGVIEALDFDNGPTLEWDKDDRRLIQSMLHRLKSYIPAATKLDEELDKNQCTIGDLKIGERCEIKNGSHETYAGVFTRRKKSNDESYSVGMENADGSNWHYIRCKTPCLRLPPQTVGDTKPGDRFKIISNGVEYQRVTGGNDGSLNVLCIDQNDYESRYVLTSRTCEIL